MKWFKHFSESHNNLKFQALLEKDGWFGYGKWWVCVELVANQGEKYHIKPGKNWKNYLKKIFNDNEDTLVAFLNTLADSKLIDKKALKRGILYIPKLREYCDDYSNKVRREYGHTTDFVPLEEKKKEKRIEEKRREENNISSKEDTSIVPFKQFGNPNINEVISFLKEKLEGSPDGGVKQNRRFAKLLLDRVAKDFPETDPVDIVKRIIDLAVKDTFHSKNATGFKYLFYHAQQIIQTYKGQLKNPKYIKL